MSRTRSSRSENAPPREGVDFGPFRLTLTPLQLWRGQKKIALQPRPLAVLRYLVEHPETVVSNDALRQAVWGRTRVSPTSVQVCMRAVRKALGDETSTPRYIETVGQEGYRFIAPLTATQPVQSSKFQVPSSDTQYSALGAQQSVLVGREAELARLHSLLEKALKGERQLVFITGEAGIGKTTLIDAFLQSLESRVQRPASKRQGLVSPVQTLDPRRQTLDTSPWLGRGQCLEHAGEGEAYLPVLEAVGQLCQGSDGADFLAILRRYAPTWLLHLPGLVGLEEWEALQRRAGATQGQMLREMAEALEAASAKQLVILVLEDLHVGDPSTVELLAYLAQRRARARLLIIGSYRPIEVILSEHPLRGRVQELLARGYGQAIALELWTEAEVATYLRRRLATAAPPAALARWVFERTDGNALFVVHMAEYLLEQRRLLLEEGQWRLDSDLTVDVVPGTLQHLILAQLHTLPAEQQQVLEAASVVGAVFPAASVAAALQRLPEVIEENCDILVQRGQFIREVGLATWPDGTVSSQYEFSHALYPEVLYQQMSAGRRMRLHLAIGACEEGGYGKRAGERAAELARHFAEGRDFSRAVQYLVQAGQNALRRSAYVEALSHFRRGLTLLVEQPETPEWKQQELYLQTGVVIAQSALKGVVQEVDHALLRAHALCQQIGETPDLVPILTGLWAFYLATGKLRTARQLAEQAFRLAHDTHQTTLLGVAQANLQATLYLQGELAATLQFVAGLHGACQEWVEMQACAAELMALAIAYGLPFWWAVGQCNHGITLAQQGNATEGIGQIQQGLAVYRAAGAAIGIPRILGWLAETYGQSEQVEEGFQVLEEAFAVVKQSDERIWEAELYRRKGELTLQKGARDWGLGAGSSSPQAPSLKPQVPSGVVVEAEGYFLKAIDIARRQQAKSWELRAIMSLVRLRQHQAAQFGSRNTQHVSRTALTEAHHMLSEVYNWFTEGFDTKDLQEAKALLDSLGARVSH